MKDLNDLVDYIKVQSLDGWRIFSFIGGGGKTTTIMNIAQRLYKMGINVAVTTTTKMFLNKDESFQDVELGNYLNREYELLGMNRIPIICSSLTEEKESGKIKGISNEDVVNLVEGLKKHADSGVILVESDGSKGRSLKAYESYEPVITGESAALFIVMGLDSIGRELTEENVHRSSLFSCRLGKDLGEIINANDYIKALFMEKGYLDVVKSQTTCPIKLILTRRKGYDKHGAEELIEGLSGRLEMYLL